MDAERYRDRTGLDPVRRGSTLREPQLCHLGMVVLDGRFFFLRRPLVDRHAGVVVRSTIGSPRRGQLDVAQSGAGPLIEAAFQSAAQSTYVRSAHLSA